MDMDTSTDLSPAAWVTDDPWTAAIYGMIAYPSLRPGVTVAVDLVADQPGPWTLFDVERAELANDLAARLRTAGSLTPSKYSSTPLEVSVEADQDPVQVVLANLRACCQEIRGLLADPSLSSQPPAVAHELLQLDQRTERFLAVIDQAAATAVATATAEGDVEVAETFDSWPARPALEWRRDELLAFIVGADLDPGAALKALRDHCTDHDKPPPRTWAEVAGNPFRIKFVLGWVADTAGARP
jgi:hypothetical protein